MALCQEAGLSSEMKIIQYLKESLVTGPLFSPNPARASLLSADGEGVPAGQESRPGGSADLLTVGLLQYEALLGQLLHPGGGHLRVVPGHVVPAQIIGQNKNDIGRLALTDN